MEQDSQHHERRVDAWKPCGDVVELVDATIRLRLAVQADIDALAAIELVSQPDPWNDEMFARELTIEWSRTWVVEDASELATESEGATKTGAGAVVAFLVFWIVEGEAHVLSVATAPVARRKGVAKYLMTEFVNACEERLIDSITLEVRAGNVGARALYSGLGFRKIGRRRGYYSDNQEDAVIMGWVADRG